MPHSTLRNCAPKVQRNGHHFSLVVRDDSGKWSCEIGGETRLYFQFDLDPNGSNSLRLYDVDRSGHGASNGRKPGRPKM